MKINLPTKLTLLRFVLIPLCMISIIYPIFSGDVIWRVVAVALFVITSLTDMLDGKLARKLNMVTDLGKFLDPLADKMLIIGVLLAVIMRYSADAVFCSVLGWTLFIVILREMGVTLLRMIAAGKAGVVLAAGWLGKVKTTVQMAAIVVMLLEPLIPATHMIVSYVMVALLLIMTLWSGLDYLRSYLPLLKEKNS